MHASRYLKYLYESARKTEIAIHWCSSAHSAVSLGSSIVVRDIVFTCILRFCTLVQVKKLESGVF